MRLFVSLTSILSGIFVALFSGFYSPKQAPLINGVENPHCSTIVFDLGGVLFDTSKKQTFWELGPQNLFWFWKNSSNSQALSQLKNRLYQLCDAVRNRTGNEYGLKDGSGVEMPQLMAEWLRGMNSNQSFIDELTSFIRTNPDWFTHTSEKRIIKQLIKTVFDPETFIKTRALYQEAVDLVKECKERGFTLYVCSNWDKESAPLLMKKYPDLFKYFDKVIFSGEVNAVKPEAEIFTPITDKVPAKDCIFIDDQPENIAAAQKAGFNVILVPYENNGVGAKPNIAFVKTQLDQINPTHEIAYGT